jgi:hypothetical protein
LFPRRVAGDYVLRTVERVAKGEVPQAGSATRRPREASVSSCDRRLFLRWHPLLGAPFTADYQPVDAVDAFLGGHRRPHGRPSRSLI